MEFWFRFYSCTYTNHYASLTPLFYDEHLGDLCGVGRVLEEVYCEADSGRIVWLVPPIL